MKIGLLFAGQGAQYTGMGKSLYEHSPAARRVMDDAGEEIKGWCFEGTKEMLRQTHITQPSIFTVNMAAYEAFLEAAGQCEGFWSGIEVGGLAGFSLGEYSALSAAGVLSDVAAGLDIVTRRGKLMMAAGMDLSGNPKGGMIAAFGARESILECVKAARKEGILEGVNFNSQIQTVVAGDKDALERFREKASEKRIKAIPLSVSTAFHSPMMEIAVEPLKQILLEKKLKTPNQKVYCNLTGNDIMADVGGNVSEELAEIMSRQAKSPVYWQETMENMIRDGIRTFIELGPGNTLSGIARKIAPDLLVLNVEDQEGLEKAIAALMEAAGKGEAC